jgi:hypothetical protein
MYQVSEISGDRQNMNRELGFCEKRRFRRVAIDIAADIIFNNGPRLRARLCDVDQGGICLEAPVALERSRHILVAIEEPAGSGKAIELKGQVAWVRPTKNGFEVGIRVYEDEFDVHVVLCALVCAGLKKAAAIAQLRDRHFLYVEWKLASLAATEAAATERDWGKPAPRRVALARMSAAKA